MSKGLVVREGVIPISKIKNYAKKNKLPFIDLRRGIAFSSVEQLSRNLSMYVSNAFRRPVRVSLESFFRGECFGKKFVAVIPHNFINDFVINTKKSPESILSTLSSNELTIS